MPVDVVVADDEGAVREFIAMVLGWEGYEVVAAADGEAALACVAARAPGLLLTDLQMPG